MKKCAAARITLLCSSVAVAAGLMGCSSTAVSSVTTKPAATTSTDAPESGISCAQGQFSPQQFTGDWTEAGDSTITTLDADGTLRSRRGNDRESGTWSYRSWSLTPAKDDVPAGQGDLCVLWLHWAQPGPPTDLVYVPLTVSATSLQLSYVGRGNTHTWVRAARPDIDGH